MATRSETIQVSGIRCERCVARLGAALNHGRILGPAGLDVLWRVHLPVVKTFHVAGPPSIEKFQMALLWRIVHRPDGHDFVYECGTFNGFNACVLDYRAEDLVVAMIFNTYAGGFPPAEKLAALFRRPPPQEKRGQVPSVGNAGEETQRGTCPRFSGPEAQAERPRYALRRCGTTLRTSAARACQAAAGSSSCSMRGMPASSTASGSPSR